MQDWVDAHSHLTDLRVVDLDSTLRKSRAQGIGWHLQGGVGPDDWSRQLEAHQKYPELIPAVGLHPYWVADHTSEECEQALDQLARVLPQAALLGETGLDFRTHIVKDSRERQMDCFEFQLELAEVSQKPLVLHIVRAFDEAIRFLEMHEGKLKGIYHSFTGSLPQAETLIELGFMISVGGAACAHGQRLDQAIAGIDWDHLVIETDSPDQSPEGWGEENNDPTSLLWVASAVAEIKKVSREEVLDRSRANLQKLLGNRWLP